MKYRLFLIFCFAILFGVACEDQNYKHIPNRPVFLKLNLTTQYPTFRDNLNDTLTFTTPRIGYEYQDRLGFGGILVVVGIGENGTKYFAYDLTCPYEASPDIRIYPKSDGKAKCKVCGSEYYLTDGWGRVSKGPSRWSLKRYEVDYINSFSGEYLIIQN